MTMYWQERLGDHWEAILVWAVGPDWQQVMTSRMPKRIRERTGLDIRVDGDIDNDLKKVREAWEAKGKREGEITRRESDDETTDPGA
jgi:hypothetical protein